MGGGGGGDSGSWGGRGGDLWKVLCCSSKSVESTWASWMGGRAQTKWRAVSRQRGLAVREESKRKHGCCADRRHGACCACGGGPGGLDWPVVTRSRRGGRATEEEGRERKRRRRGGVRRRRRGGGEEEVENEDEDEDEGEGEEEEVVVAEEEGEEERKEGGWERSRGAGGVGTAGRRAPPRHGRWCGSSGQRPRRPCGRGGQARQRHRRAPHTWGCGTPSACLGLRKGKHGFWVNDGGGGNGRRGPDDVGLCAHRDRRSWTLLSRPCCPREPMPWCRPVC